MRIRATISSHLALLALPVLPVTAQSTVEFENTRPIEINTIPDEGEEGVLWRVASPYPSTISVSGFGPQATIAKVTVTLHRMYHDFPDDVDILLVGPDGQSIVLFSDAGGDVWDSDLELSITLDDDAKDRLPDDAPIQLEGAYRPGNFENDEGDAEDVFPQVDDEGHPAPHPDPSSTTALSVFSGAYPNGEWRLYVVDDETEDSGHIAGGWSLAITTVKEPELFRRGDADGGGAVNLTDAVLTLTALFLGGAQPACADAADADDNGFLSLADAVYTLNHLFRGGPAPPAPGADTCGIDPTADDLPCDSLLPCRAEGPPDPAGCPGVDLNWDSGNCGACGIVCPEGFACSAGVCEGSP